MQAIIQENILFLILIKCILIRGCSAERGLLINKNLSDMKILFSSNQFSYDKEEFFTANVNYIVEIHYISIQLSVDVMKKILFILFSILKIYMVTSADSDQQADTLGHLI